MRRHPLPLVALLLTIGGLTLWARWPTPHEATAIQPLAIAQGNTAQDSPPPTPTLTPTPPPPMPTPPNIEVVGADWQSLHHPIGALHFKFRQGGQ